MREKELIAYLNSEIINVLQFKHFTPLTKEEATYIDEVEGAELRELLKSVQNTLLYLSEAKEFVLSLSNGNLEVEPPIFNPLISPLKQLHSNLRHLVWQIGQVAKGDYSQNLDFLGEFSLHFNRLVQSLKEREEIEQELKRSEGMYKLLAENISDVIWIYNLDRDCFTYVSPSVVFLTGFTDIEAMGQTFKESVSADSYEQIGEWSIEAIDTLSKFPNQKIVYTNQVQQLCKDGRYIWIEAVVEFRLTEVGEVEILGVSRNIEKRKEIENKLKKQTLELTKLNENKNRFLQILAHDLRNPFTVLLGFSELLLSNFREFNPEEIEEQLTILNQTAKGTYTLLNDLLLWSRSQSGNLPFDPQKRDVIALCKDVVADKSNKFSHKEISILCEKNGLEELILPVDTNMIKTILRNLLSNAIKFSHRGDEVLLTVERGEKFITVTIKDNGVGISPQNQKLLWDYSKPLITKGTEGEEGSGLGLLLCKEFVEAHGGKIWVESEPNRGAAFKFTLPLNREQIVDK
ncbi:MAG: PAS domain-containing sensor histidine kinase [Bacteroidales bacterium]